MAVSSRKKLAIKQTHILHNSDLKWLQVVSTQVYSVDVYIISRTRLNRNIHPKYSSYSRTNYTYSDQTFCVIYFQCLRSFRNDFFKYVSYKFGIVEILTNSVLFINCPLNHPANIQQKVKIARPKRNSLVFDEKEDPGRSTEYAQRQTAATEQTERRTTMKFSPYAYRVRKLMNQVSG